MRKYKVGDFRLIKIWMPMTASTFYELWQYEKSSMTTLWGKHWTTLDKKASGDYQWARKTAKNYGIEIEDFTKSPNVEEQLWEGIGL